MNNQLQDVTAPATQWLLYTSGSEATREAVDALANAAEPRVTVRHHYSLDFALAEDPSLPVIVPIAMPLQHMCAMMADGATPDEAMAQWRGQAEAVLKACRKHRRRVVLIDAGMLQAAPSAFVDVLSTRLGLRFATVSPPEPGTKSEFAEIHTAIASAALAGDARATDLADELEAMMLGPVTARTLSDDVTQAAMHKLHKLRASLDKKEDDANQLNAKATELESKLSKAETDLALITEERELLRENVRLLLESTESLMAENAKLADRPLLKAQSEALARQLADAQETQRLREAALGTEILRLAAQMKDERGRLGSELQYARDEIGGLLASTSWRVTRPIRVVKRGLRRG